MQKKIVQQTSVKQLTSENLTTNKLGYYLQFIQKHFSLLKSDAIDEFKASTPNNFAQCEKFDVTSDMAGTDRLNNGTRYSKNNSLL